MTSPTGTTTRPSTRPTRRPVPKIVRTRQRLILFAEIGIAIMLLSVPLQVTLPETGPWVWIVGGIMTGWSAMWLRTSTHNQDQRPEDELDEYELQRRYLARGRALRWSTISLLAIFFLGGASVLTLQIMSNAGTDTQDAYRNVLQAFIYLTVTALYVVQVVELRDITNGMNRDILISGDAEDATSTTTTREDPS